MAKAKMVSLAMTPKEAKAELGYPASAPTTEKSDLPKYPYDTRVTLGTDALEKLDVSPSDFKVGETIEITAKVEVIEVSASKRQGGNERNEVRLQITDLAMDTAAKKKAKAEDEHLNSISGTSSDMEDED